MRNSLGRIIHPEYMMYAKEYGSKWSLAGYFMNAASLKRDLMSHTSDLRNQDFDIKIMKGPRTVLKYSPDQGRWIKPRAKRAKKK